MRNFDVNATVLTRNGNPGTSSIRVWAETHNEAEKEARRRIGKYGRREVVLDIKPIELLRRPAS